MSPPTRYGCKLVVLLCLCACVVSITNEAVNETETTTTTAKTEAAFPEAESSLVETSVKLEGQETRSRPATHGYSNSGKGYLQQESAYNSHPHEEQSYEYGKRIAGHYKGNDGNAYQVPQTGYQQEVDHYPQAGYISTQDHYEQQPIGGYDQLGGKGNSYQVLENLGDGYGQSGYGKDEASYSGHQSGAADKPLHLQYDYEVPKTQQHITDDHYDAKSYVGQPSYASGSTGYQGKGSDDVSYSQEGPKEYSSPVSHTSHPKGYNSGGNDYGAAGKVSHFPVIPRESGYISGGSKEPDYLHDSPKELAYQQEAGYLPNYGKDSGVPTSHSDSKNGKVAVFIKQIGHSKAGDQYGSKNGERHGYLLLPVVPGKADDKIKIVTTGGAYGGNEYKDVAQGGQSSGYSQKPIYENKGKASFSSYFKSGISTYGGDSKSSIPAYGGNSKSGISAYGGSSELSYDNSGHYSPTGGPGYSKSVISAYDGGSKSSHDDGGHYSQGGGSGYPKSGISSYGGGSKSSHDDGGHYSQGGGSKSSHDDGGHYSQGGGSGYSKSGISSYGGGSKSSHDDGGHYSQGGGSGYSKSGISSYGGGSKSSHDDGGHYSQGGGSGYPKSGISEYEGGSQLSHNDGGHYGQVGNSGYSGHQSSIGEIGYGGVQVIKGHPGYESQYENPKGNSYEQVHISNTQIQQAPLGYEAGKSSSNHGNGYGVTSDNVKYVPAHEYEHQQAYKPHGINSYQASSYPKGSPYGKEVPSHDIHSSYTSSHPSQKGSYDVAKTTSPNYGKEQSIKGKYSQSHGYESQKSYGGEGVSPYATSSLEKPASGQIKGFPPLSYGAFTPMISPYGSVVDFSRSVSQNKKVSVSSKGHGDSYKNAGVQQQGGYGQRKPGTSSYRKPKSYAIVLQRPQAESYSAGYGSSYPVSSSREVSKSLSLGYSEQGFRPIFPKYSSGAIGGTSVYYNAQPHALLPSYSMINHAKISTRKY